MIKLFGALLYGYIGTAIADRLRAAGHKLTGLARSEKAAARLKAMGIRSVRGDFSEPASTDALTLDQQASGRHARELRGWRPHRPDVLEDIERGSYAGAGG